MLSLLFGPARKRANVDINDERYWTPSVWSPKTTAGPRVDGESALTYAAVWCATRILCETSAMLPLFTYRRLAGDNREFATDIPLFDVLHSAPNPEMASMPFREAMMQDIVNAGNGFAEIERDPRTGDVVALWPIHASRVSPVSRTQQMKNGQNAYQAGFRYKVKNDDNTYMIFRADEILHVPGVLSTDGIWGRSVIDYARESVGFGLATEQHGAGYFGSGGVPPGILFAPGMKDAEARRGFRAEWKEVHGSPDSSEIAILPLEAKFQQLSMSNENAQFLETRKHNIGEIARWYRLPLYMLQEYEKAATYASIEALGNEFVTYSLLPWLVRVEQQCRLKLLRPDEREEFFIEHQVGGLLRGDSTSRASFYETMQRIGVMTINETRQLENLNGIGDLGDVHFVLSNLMPLERLVNPPEPAPAPAPTPAPEPDPEEDDDDADEETGDEPPAESAERRNQRRMAAHTLLADVLGRMLAIEANECRRAVAAKKDLGEWLPTFLAGHREKVRAAIEPVYAACAALGFAFSPGSTALRLSEDSERDLLAAYNTDTPTQFAARLEAWRERAGIVAGEMVR